MSAAHAVRFLSPPDHRGTELHWLEPFRQLIAERLGLRLPPRFDRQFGKALDAAAAACGQRDAEGLRVVLAGEDWMGPAWQAIIAGITVRETSFFRQSGWWEGIVGSALLPLIDMRRADGSRRLRCLSIGCASGDEPYSLAMVLERLLRGEPGWTIEITGLDLCQAALSEAAAGVYDQRAIREVPVADRERWLRALPRQRYALSEELRQRVNLRLFNLAEAARQPAPGAAPGAPADLVICRNVLIHMEPACQIAIARYLGQQLRSGGYLAVSPVEATPAWFAPLRFHATPQAILFEKPAEKRRSATRTSRPSEHPAGSSGAEHSLRVSATPAALAPLHLPPSASPLAPKPEAGSAGPLRHARQLADRGLFAEARRLCEQILDDNEESHLLMALVCQALGDLPSAQAAARRARAAAPHSPAAHYVMAIISLRAGRAQEARRALREAVRLLEGGLSTAARGEWLGIGANEIRQAARRLGITVQGN